MKGHIRKRSKGSWAIVIDVGRDAETGKRRQRWHTVKGTKKDAERALRQILYSMETGNYIEPNRITVGEWLNQWCEGYVAIHTTVRTQESYRSIVKHHLMPAFGNTGLAQLQPQQIQRYYARALAGGRADGTGGLSARSVLYHHRILKEALKHAVKMGLVARNVAEAVDPPRAERVTMNILSPEEIPAFLDAATETPYYMFYSTLLYMGFRRGEGLALKWRHVDLLGMEVQVVETAFKLNDGTYVFKEPKTAHSRRSVAIPPSLAVLLRQHKEDQREQRSQLGRPLSENDLVFSRPDGSPLDPNHVTRTFPKIAKKLGLPHIRLHDLRHTHATLMLKAGVHPKIVSERLGHANIGITLDIYSHVLPGLQEAAAERFDKMLNEETANEENKRANVSKMLAKGGEDESEPCRVRTGDTLIKSHGVGKMKLKESKEMVLTR
jgi:integrase